MAVYRLHPREYSQRPGRNLMPELPELEALARGLDAAMAGATVTEARLHLPAALKGADPAPEALVGGSVERVWRRGKLIGVQVGDLTAVIHLMSAGRLGLTTPGAARAPRNAAFDLGLSDGRALRLRELSSTHRATLHVLRPEALATHRPLARLGPEPLGLSAEGWRTALGPAARPPAHRASRRPPRRRHRTLLRGRDHVGRAARAVREHRPPRR